MAGRGKKFIDAVDVVRKQDGRIDLFNTILARKDPEAQIPALVSGASISSPRSPKVSPSLESNAPPSVSVDQGLSRSSPSPPAEGETVAFAKVHMLVIPRTKVDKLSDLSGDTGLNILLELQERADWLLNRLKTETPDVPFLEYKMGFHIVPSLVQLHLHVISQDFCSASLKNKKHWNSFTTSFFVELSMAIEKIKRDKTLALSSGERKSFEDELKRPLECNQCSVRPSNLPALKKHLEQHFDQRAKAWRESQK
ncbi:aprataxin [Entomortierella parvispora]|uniref:Aprataxin n=1 Tax=Entomortierella parvispora TaxID=205924 RepID=A0A9P3LQE0_9FUNG|nr:aprataxin [Entomortierella parvispora]